MAEHRAIRGWGEVLGEAVSKYTGNVYFNRGVLYVQLTSAVLRAELLMNKEGGLIKKIKRSCRASNYKGYCDQIKICVLCITAFH